MSKVSCAPRWTPPMPPVAKISMPASPATNMVAATVVPAEPRRAATAARSRREAFTTPPVSWASPSISCRSRPTRNRPLITAIVAGMAPTAHGVLDHPRGLDVARIGHAMGDDRRFERDERAALGARLRDLGGEVDQIGDAHSGTPPFGGRLSEIAGAGSIRRVGEVTAGRPRLWAKARPCWSRLADWDSVAEPIERAAGRGRRPRSLGNRRDGREARTASGGAARPCGRAPARADRERRARRRGRRAAGDRARPPRAAGERAAAGRRQAPPGVDLFDLTLSKGDRPRVFLDMVAFIEMARDRRTYRFFQDTVYGRVLIAESPKIDTIVAAGANYVARRLVERERALTSEIPLGEAGDEAEAAAATLRSARPRAGPCRTRPPPPCGLRRPPGRAIFAARLAGVLACLVDGRRRGDAGRGRGARGRSRLDPSAARSLDARARIPILIRRPPRRT